MKMYEKLGIDPTTEEGIIRLLSICCSDIPDREGDNAKRLKDCPHPDLACGECKAKRLIAEAPTKTVIRGTTYTDFKEAYNDYAKENVGHSLYGVEFVSWLNEEIEVEK